MSILRIYTSTAVTPLPPSVGAQRYATASGIRQTAYGVQSTAWCILAYGVAALEMSVYGRSQGTWPTRTTSRHGGMEAWRRALRAWSFSDMRSPDERSRLFPRLDSVACEVDRSGCHSCDTRFVDICYCVLCMP